MCVKGGGPTALTWHGHPLRHGAYAKLVVALPCRSQRPPKHTCIAYADQLTRTAYAKCLREALAGDYVTEGRRSGTLGSMTVGACVCQSWCNTQDCGLVEAHRDGMTAEAYVHCLRAASDAYADCLRGLFTRMCAL